MIYHGGAVDPFAHLDADQTTTSNAVFYATNRRPNSPGHYLPYGNRIDTQTHLGKAVVQMGGTDSTWAQLYAASITPSRRGQIELTLKESHQIASLQTAENGAADPTPEQRDFAAQINAELAKAEDRELMIYIHGTKVDFLNGCALAAEIDHFAGRDFVSIAFSWPSHQNILTYLDRIDVRRAKNSTAPLQALIEFLAAHTDAQRINLLGYSAGCRVASLALSGLRKKHSNLSAQEVRSKFRIGSTIFAAADVPVAAFDERLSAIADISESVVVTVSDNDGALKTAMNLMGGGIRAGMTGATGIEEAAATLTHVTNLQIIDVSHGQDIRGFDITGHHYWYRHPWVSSDIVLNLRTNLHPSKRGLKRIGADSKVWYLPHDYPQRVRKATKHALRGTW